MNDMQNPPMKWHKFLIYFLLWFNAVISALSGVRMLTGSQYGSQDVIDTVYQRFQGLKSADMVFGLLSIAMAVFLIYTRFQLAGLKPGAPGKLTATYVLSLALNAGYMLVVSGITKLSLQDLGSSSLVGSIVGSVVMLIANHSYYQKRAHLFGGTPPASQPQPQPQARFCTKCGQKADPADKWCTRCGTKLD